MREQTAGGGRGEQGFSLIEAMVAMVILIFGVAAVANLMVVAGSSNTVANHTTAAASAATQQMELLKTASYETLVGGGTVDPSVPLPSSPGDCGAVPVTAFGCTTRMSGGNPDFVGVGTIYVRWMVGPTVAMGTTTTRFVTVAAESMAPAIRSRSRVVLTTFRTDNQ